MDQIGQAVCEFLTIKIPKLGINGGGGGLPTLSLLYQLIIKIEI